MKKLCGGGEGRNEGTTRWGEERAVACRTFKTDQKNQPKKRCWFGKVARGQKFSEGIRKNKERTKTEKECLRTKTKSSRTHPSWGVPPAEKIPYVRLTMDPHRGPAVARKGVNNNKNTPPNNEPGNKKARSKNGAKVVTGGPQRGNRHYSFGVERQ